jgi:hypothetical protein
MPEGNAVEDTPPHPDCLAAARTGPDGSCDPPVPWLAVCDGPDPPGAVNRMLTLATAFARLQPIFAVDTKVVVRIPKDVQFGNGDHRKRATARTATAGSHAKGAPGFTRTRLPERPRDRLRPWSGP